MYIVCVCVCVCIYINKTQLKIIELDTSNGTREIYSFQLSSKTLSPRD